MIPTAHITAWRSPTPRLRRLRAEMKLPGRSWLQWEVEPDTPGHAVIHQTAIYDPAGLLGLAYWYLVYPLLALLAPHPAHSAAVGEDLGGTVAQAQLAPELQEAAYQGGAQRLRLAHGTAGAIAETGRVAA